MEIPRRSRRRGLIAATIGACLLVPAIAVTAASPATANAGAGSAAPANASGLGPEVRHTGEAPTGYEVTFRYYAPNATRVQITGEWYFEDPSALPQLAATPGHPVRTQGILPAQWKPGDVPIQYPSSLGGNFPVFDMRQAGDSGVWTYTTPLPSGVFSYGFLVNCTTSDQSGCSQLPDPANPAWSIIQGVKVTSTVDSSEVYVPSDPKFGTMDLSWQGPALVKGELTHITYDSPGHVTPANRNYLVVYTPPGYDPNRATPYPVVYLQHGGGGNEMDWSTQGDAANILDNLINAGEIQPLLAVIPVNEGYVDAPNYGNFDNDLINTIIPYIQSHYNASRSASGRAFTGLSEGGAITNSLMLYHTSAFGYYGMMSAGLAPGIVLSSSQVAALKKVTIMVGAGWQDTIFADGFTTGGVQYHTGPAKEVRTLVNAQIPVATDFVNGGHNWWVWRLLLKDFVTRVAFWPSPAANW
jgi:enterochelin esterase-like enzyme